MSWWVKAFQASFGFIPFERSMETPWYLWLSQWPENEMMIAAWGTNAKLTHYHSFQSEEIIHDTSA
ncbi:hypothetical protein HK16_15960 [Acetobacter senegalensis]|uniref:Uncharacterized protein n=2 Tax=Acetobacter TaxID=434 RepID=A0A252EG76_9PROT|nr:hypothetical protein CIW82_17635 [Acetobacter tropicalis]OUL65491.1 hypothetical protein HK16_15960 [Acetobacter senegalensis]